MKTVTIEAKSREMSGNEARTLRQSGQVPCVMYGENGNNYHFSAPTISFKELLYVPGLRQAEIHLNGQTHRALIKESQYDPVSDNLIHVDFQELKEGRPVRAEIPVRTVGRAKGEVGGGIIYVNVPRLKVNGLPASLKEFIEVDVSELDLNDSVRISDLSSSHPDLTFNHPATVSVVSVETSRAVRAAAAEEAAAAAAKAAAEAAAPVVVEGEKKAEEAAPEAAAETTEAKKEE
jgi:large subunit ribosomal protein L25